MKSIVWLVLLFTAAVVAAMTLGANDGLVSIYWRGWRFDLSLNLFIIGLVAAFLTVGSGLRAVRWLFSLPGRAQAWRDSRRDQALQAAQREAFIEYSAGRYTRAVKAARRAQSLLEDLPHREGAAETRAIGHLLAALALHRLQDRAGRDAEAQALQVLLRPTAPAKSATPTTPAADATSAPAPSIPVRGTALHEGLSLLRAEWALDDRDAQASLDHLTAMAPGAARRTQALRLRLQAQRMAGLAAEALRTARLLIKHQAFRAEAASSLLRALAVAQLDAARDMDGLQQAWLDLERSERADTVVLAHAARRAQALGDPAWSRRVLRPAWDQAASLPVDQRADLAWALWAVCEGIEADWLPGIEALVARHAREPAITAIAAVVYAERRLWGKAQGLLEQTTRASVPADVRRDAWLRLARLAIEQGDEDRAHECHREAAEVR